jgi:branched-chain amino acid transport system substrate-binding protein
MYIFAFFSIAFFQIIQGFTLEQWSTYSKTIPEFPSPDKQVEVNWTNPNYSSFLETIRPSLFSRIMQMYGIQSGQWTPLFFKNILEQVTESRLILKHEFNNVALLTVEESTKIFVWGDTHAAFHSLLRGLCWLKEEQVINEMGKILDKNTYFLFHGDQIDRGPYSMETLSLIAQILKENPEQALYLQGTHEANGYWRNFGLKQELRIRASHLDNEFIPLNQLIENFFSTLSTALCINTKNNQDHYIVFSFHGLDEPYLKNFNPSDQKKVRFEHHDEITVPFPKIGSFVEALISTEEWRKHHRAHHGLGLQDQVFGATTWAVFSSPIEVNQIYYNFHNDAFVKIIIDPSNIRKSSIQLYTHSLENQTLHFENTESYNLITSRPLSHMQPEAEGNDIVLGSSLSLIQGVPIMGERVKRGISIAVNEQNQKGGIGGKHIRFFPLNDDFIPYKTKRNTEFYLENKITDIFIGSTGSPTLEVLTEYMKEKTVAVIGPITGDPLFLNPQLKGLINITGSYDVEINAHLNSLIKEHYATNFAFFYQIELPSVIQIIREILKKNGINKWIEIPYTRGIVDFKFAAEKLKRAEVDVIGILATSQATQSFIKEVGVEYLSTKKLFGYSFLGDAAFREFIKETGISMQLTTRVPNPTTSELEIVTQYQNAMKKNDALFDADSLEGYIVARLTIDLMQKCKGNITKDTLLEQAEALKNFEWNGLTFNFDPKTRTLMNTIWLERPHEETIQVN